MIALAGCARWSAHGVVVAPARRVRILVLPVRNEAEVDSLRQILTVPGTGAVPDEPARIRAHMAAAMAQLTRDVNKALDASPWFAPASPAPAGDPPTPGGGAHAPAAAAPAPPHRPLDAAEARRLGRATHADAVMAMHVDAYGHLNHRWTEYLIGSGVVEGTVQGAVVYGATGSTGLALLVGGEEIGQEVLEWGGGSWLFNRWFDPVILHASLRSTTDGHEIWSDDVFATTDHDALDKLPKAQQALRQVRLRVTAHNAAHTLVGELNDAAKLRYHNRSTVFSSADVGDHDD